MTSVAKIFVHRSSRRSEGVDGSGGIAGVQARISEIVSRFQVAPAGRGVLGAGEAQQTADFAAQLAQASDAQGGVDVGTYGSEINAAGVNPNQWSRDFLTKLGMPVSAENIRAVNAWQQAEGTRAKFNPLATTQPWQGATKFNSVGVKNYQSYEDGLAANVDVIQNGKYENILAALRKGTSAMEVAQAIKNSPWGSGDLVIKILQQQ